MPHPALLQIGTRSYGHNNSCKARIK